ncbi:winged helix-turn-helix transcriptional regulator [Propionibacteriaceae bacterium Y1685]
MPTKRSYASQGDACATAHAMELVGDRWTYPVVRELMLGPKRFAELENALLGITPAVLTARLRQMESAGLVRRGVRERTKVYELTDWARDLRPVLEDLGRWAMQSPIRSTEGGLTPDAAVQSMLTVAPRRRMSPPIEVALHLRDDRADATTYSYRLHWAAALTIERSPARQPQATVVADSSTWADVVHNSRDLSAVDVRGDVTVVRRILDVIQADYPHTSETPPRADDK